MRAAVVTCLVFAAVAAGADATTATPALATSPILDDLGDPGDPRDPANCPAPRPGTLTLNTVPWTVVYVDGVAVGTTPLYRFELPAGAHQLALINKDRGVNVIDEVTIEEGRAHKLKLLLAADEGETLLTDAHDSVALDCVDDNDAGFVTVQTSPWSKVWIDGKLVGVTPLFQQRVRAGEHALRFKGKDGQLVAVRVLVAQGEVIKVALALPAPLMDPAENPR